MYTYSLHQHINDCVRENVSDIAGVDNGFYLRFLANATAIESLFNELYGHHPERNAYFDELLATIIAAYKERSPMLKAKDLAKEAQGHWFLSNEIAGMSLYVDRFCGSLAQLPEKLSYFETLGVNLLHLMPIFESPEGESDGGYAVSNFRKVDRRFGNNNDLLDVSQALHEKDMYLMLDIVLNHTSHHH